MEMHRRHSLRRTDLFLVRVWTAETEDDSCNAAWHGRIQRTVDGEAHPFDDWQALVDLLVAMLAEGQEPADEGAE